MTDTHSLCVTLHQGSLYLSGAVYDRYFAGLETVILLRREDDLLILPVKHAAAGGYLLKLKNSAGDRVVNAMEFFRFNEIDNMDRQSVEVGWDSNSAALRARSVFKSAN